MTGSKQSTHRFKTVAITLALGLTLSACAKDDATGGSGGGESTTDDTTDDTTTDGPTIGNPVGDPIAIDHATAAQTVEDNIIHHLDGLQNTLEFLEDSNAINNLVELVFGDDEDDDSEDGEEDETASESDDGIEIEMSDMRDSLVEMMSDQMMVEANATVADDGLSIAYTVSADTFCTEEAEDDESEERAAERAEEEAECADRLAENPLTVGATSDAEGDVNLSLMVGATPTEVMAVQLHDDQISAHVDLTALRDFVGVFVSPDDFELPRTMDGAFGFEVRQDADMAYTIRFAIIEDINITPDADQEPFALHMTQADSPGSIAFDGAAKTIDGAIELAEMDAALPWQIIVDMFYDDEGSSEWMCETNEDTGEEDCWEEWTEPEPAPEVDEAFIVDVPGVTGTIAYTATDDAFVLTNLGLGDRTMDIKVDDDTIVSIDVNAEQDRRLDFTFDAPTEHDLGLAFSTDFEAHVQFAWHKVSDAFDDLPDFLADDTLGVRFAEADSPQIQIVDVKDDTQIQMARGQLTLWADGMDEDVVINEGECFVGTGCEGDDCDDEEDTHDLFGEIGGGSCDE